MFGYYLASNTPAHPKSKDLFEFFQGEFEKFCEHLAKVIEQDFYHKLLIGVIIKGKEKGELDKNKLDARN